MSQDTAVAAALEERLDTVEGMLAPGQIERPNRSPEIRREDEGRPWARLSYLYGGETLQTLPAPGGRLLKRGFLQVDLYFPLGQGPEPLDELADAIRERFPARLQLSANGQRLEVTMSRRSGGRRDGKWWWDHVDLYWALWAVNPSF